VGVSLIDHQHPLLTQPLRQQPSSATSEVGASAQTPRSGSRCPNLPPRPPTAPSERCQRCAAPTGDANALHGGLVHQLRVPQARPACPGNRHMPGRARAAAPAQWAAPMVGGSDCGWQQAAGTRGGQSHHGGENARALGGFWSPPRLVVAAGWRWLESTPIRSGPTGPRVHQGG
jgi:hypothetical protein